jgi:SAM-dependent methyltransferase
MATTSVRGCPGCGGTSSRALGIKRGFELRRCRACGTVFTARLPAPQEAANYGGYYHAGNLQERPLARERLGELVASFDRYRQANRWLDVGFGAGTLMRAAADAGWSVAGTEVAPAAAEAVRGLGLEVHLGDLSELELPKRSFDVVSFVEVVEHVPDAQALLGRAAGLLRAGGAVYLTTPNGRGISAMALRERWSVMAPPDHLQLFSVKGVKSALRRAGLSTTSVQTHGVNPYELLAAVRRNGFTPSDRGTSSRRLNESLSSSRGGRRVKRLANTILDLSRLGDTVKVVAERSP